MAHTCNIKQYQGGLMNKGIKTTAMVSLATLTLGLTMESASATPCQIHPVVVAVGGVDESVGGGTSSAIDCGGGGGISGTGTSDTSIGIGIGDGDPECLSRLMGTYPYLLYNPTLADLLGVTDGHGRIDTDVPTPVTLFLGDLLLRGFLNNPVYQGAGRCLSPIEAVISNPDAPDFTVPGTGGNCVYTVNTIIEGNPKHYLIGTAYRNDNDGCVTINITCNIGNTPVDLSPTTCIQP
jgi:hypothetical protein